MIEAKVVNRINFPKIALQDDLEYIAGYIIIPDMIGRIKQGKSIMGGRLPENEPATINRKGHDRQLQDTGTLLNSFIYSKEGKDKVKITIAGERYEIGSYLQSGIRTNMGIKSYAFFGISVFAYRKAMEYMRKRIKEITSGGAGK